MLVSNCYSEYVLVTGNILFCLFEGGWLTLLWTQCSTVPVMSRLIGRDTSSWVIITQNYFPVILNIVTSVVFVFRGIHLYGHKCHKCQGDHSDSKSGYYYLLLTTPWESSTSGRQLNIEVYFHVFAKASKNILRLLCRFLKGFKT